MKTPTKKAAASTAARNNQQFESYQSFAPTSSKNLKEQIAELLLYLQRPLSKAEQQVCLKDFESVLREYVGYREQQL